jgi:hypothetical protein
VIVVDHGTIKFDGDPAKAIQQYQRAPWRQADPQVDVAGGKAGIRITRVDLLNEAGEPAPVFQTNGTMRVRIGYTATTPVADASFAVDIHRGDGIYCAGFNTMIDRRSMGTLLGSGTVDLTLSQLSVLPGYYLLSVGILDASGGTHDLQLRAFPFSVTSDRRDLGVMYVEHEWNLEGCRDGVATHTAARVDDAVPGDLALLRVECAS